jgi:hypothetical protein
LAPAWPAAREAPRAHGLKIRKNKRGELVGFLLDNGGAIFWTEGYSSKASAKNAIESIKKNGPGADTIDKSDD